MKNKFLLFFLFISFQSNLLAQWESLGSGVSEGQRKFFSFSAVDENVMWAAPIRTTFSPTYVYTKTTDGGMTWEEGSLPDTIGSYYPTNIFALDENTAWMTMVNIPQQHDCRIFKTADGGSSWIEQVGEFNDEGHTFATLHFFNENEGLGFGSPGTNNPAIDSLQIFRTADGGDTWNRIPPSTLPAPLAGEGVWVYSGSGSYEVKGDTIWFVTRASRVFRSVDKGQSWEAFDVGILGNSQFPGLSSIAFEDSMNGIATTFGTRKAARTTDGGETWTEINIPNVISLAAIEYIPGTEDTYMIHSGFQGSTILLLTEDGGMTWESQSHSPPVECIQFVSPTVGFGGGTVSVPSDRGIFKWTGDLSDSMTTNVEDNLIELDIVKVYPNPIQDRLVIELTEEMFDLDALTFEIFSMNGQLMQQWKYKSEEDLNIDVGNLMQGIYQLKISDESVQKSILKNIIKF